MTAVYHQNSNLDSNAISSLQYIAAQASELSSTPRRAGLALINVDSSEVDIFENVNRNGGNQKTTAVRTDIATVNLATSIATSADVSEDESGNQELMQLLDKVSSGDNDLPSSPPTPDLHPASSYRLSNLVNVGASAKTSSIYSEDSTPTKQPKSSQVIEPRALVASRDRQSVLSRPPMARLANPKPKAVIKKPEAAARKATPNGLKRKKPAASTGANPNLVDWDEDLRGWDDGEDVEEESQSPAKRVKVARRKKQDESQNSTKSKKQTKAVASKKSSVKRTPKESSKKVKARAQTPTVASTRPRRQQKKALEYAEDSDIESAEDEVQPLSSPAHDTGRTSVDSEGNAPDQPHDEDILDASTVDRQGSMPTAIDVIEEDARRTQQRNGSRGPAVNVPMSPEVPQSAVEAPIIGQTDDTDLEEVQDSYPKQDTTIASTHDQDPTGFADALATQIEITHLLPQRTSLSSATKFVHDINSARKHTTKSPSVRKTPAPKRPSGSTSHVPALTKVNPTHRLQPDHAENPSKDDSDEASRNPPTPIRLQDIDRTSSRDENLQTQMKPTAVEAPRRPLARLDNLRLEPLIAKTNLKQTPIAQISSVKPPKQPVLRSSLHVLGSIAPVQSPVTPVSLTQREPVQQTHEAPRYQFGLPDQVHSLQSEAPQLDVEVELAEEHDDHVERVACETERGVVSAISNGRHESGSPPVDSHHSPRILAGTTELPATQDTLLISPDPVEDLFQSNTTSPREIPAILGIREDESEEEQEQSDTDSEYQDSDIIEESAHTEVLTELSSSIRRRESQQLSPPRLSIGSPPVQRRLPRLTQAASPAARPQAPEDMGVQLMVTEFAHGQDTIDTSFFKKSRNAPLSVSQKEMPPPPTPIRRRSSTKHGVMVTTANSIGPFVGEKTRDERRLVSKAKAPVLLEVRCEIHRDPSVAPTTPPNVPLQAPTYSSSQSWPAELRKRGRGLIERDASALEASKNQDDTNGEADTTLVGDPQADIEMLDDDSVYPPRNRTRKIQSHNSLAKPQCRRNDRQQRHTIGEETLENEIRESHRPLHSLMTKLADDLILRLGDEEDAIEARLKVYRLGGERLLAELKTNCSGLLKQRRTEETKSARDLKKRLKGSDNALTRTKEMEKAGRDGLEKMGEALKRKNAVTRKGIRELLAKQGDMLKEEEDEEDGDGDDEEEGMLEMGVVG